MQDEKQEMSFEDHVSRNALITIGCTFLQLITRFFIPPIVLHYVPLEVYGLWAYCFIFIAYFSVSLTGISNVYVRYAAIYLSQQLPEKVSALLSTGSVFSALTGLLFVLCSWFFLPFFFPLLSISENLSNTAFFLIFGAILVFSLEMILSMYKSLLQGLQRVGLQSWIQTLSQMLETILIIVFLTQGLGIFSLLYAYAIQVLVSNCACAFFCRRLIPTLSVSWKHIHRSVFFDFLDFGGIIQLRTILAIMNRSLTRIFSGIFFGSWATAFYDLGEKFPNTITSIPLSGIQVSLPANAHLHAKGETLRIQNLYIYSCRYVAMISGLFLGFLTPFCWVLISFWLGPDPKYRDVALIFAFFAVPYHISVVTGPASAVYRGINRPIIELIFGVSEVGSAILGVLVGFYLFGATFTVINVGVGLTLTLVSLGYLLFTNKYLKILQWDFCKKVIFPGFVPYLVGLLVLLLFYPFISDLELNRWRAFCLLALASIPYTLIILPLYYFVFLEQKEWNAVCQKLFDGEKKCG